MSKPNEMPAAPLKQKTWYQLRQEMATTYGRWYTPMELRQMELKWRRAFAEAGFSVKGE